MKTVELDNLIVGLLVEDSKDDTGKVGVRVKFLAISGGCGPELTMERSMAVTLRDKLNEYLS